MTSSPRITIVTPSYNQAQYIEQTIRSILDQGYPNLEYVIIDGGSTDGSVDIIRRYEDRLAYWVSEKDRGQTHAINKGMERATGDVRAYLNSDDCLEPGCLSHVGEFFQNNPKAQWLAGGCRVFGEGIETWHLHPEIWTDLADVLLPWTRPQRYVFPQSGACFMRRSLVEQLGPYDETLHYSMDMEYYTRAAFSGAMMHIIPNVLAGWRWHPNAKSWKQGVAYAFRKDELIILERYMDQLPVDQYQRAKREYSAQSQEVIIREANYLINGGSRYKGLRMLASLGLRSPAWLCRRPWLGGVRRGMFAIRGESN